MAAQWPPEQLDRVMHAQLRDDGFRIIASDVPADRYKAPNPMTQPSLNMYTEADGVPGAQRGRNGVHAVAADLLG